MSERSSDSVGVDRKFQPLSSRPLTSARITPLGVRLPPTRCDACTRSRLSLDGRRGGLCQMPSNVLSARSRRAIGELWRRWCRGVFDRTVAGSFTHHSFPTRQAKLGSALSASYSRQARTTTTAIVSTLAQR